MIVFASGLDNDFCNDLPIILHLHHFAPGTEGKPPGMDNTHGPAFTTASSACTCPKASRPNPGCSA